MKLVKSKFLLLSLSGVFAVFLCWVPSAFALDPSSISVDVAPSSPAPYQNVTITLSSFSANLDTVNITWLLDGKNALSGVGKKSFSLTAKAANVSTSVLAKIFMPDGEIDKNITISPAVMVLLWQADDSYVPPFYKGKAMPSPSSEVKVVAMPEIKESGIAILPTNLTYTWKEDYNNMPDASGYGKNFFTYINDYLQDSNNVDVTASTIDQNFSSEASLNISTTNPEISFYKQDANMGTLWENALADGHQITGDEIILAAPYFISPKDIRRPELVFNWSINDSTVNIANFIKNILPVKVPAGSTGQSKVSLEIDSTDKIFETATKAININF